MSCVGKTTKQDLCSDTAVWSLRGHTTNRTKKLIKCTLVIRMWVKFTEILVNL